MKKQLRIKKWSANLLVVLLTFVLSMSIFIACKDNKEVVSNEVQEVTNSYLKFDGKYLDHLNAVKIEQVKDLDKPITHLSSEVSERNFENIKISLLKKLRHFQN